MRNLKRDYRRSMSLAVFLMAVAATAATAQQSSAEFCIGLGHKPGSANYYRCLEAHQNVKPQGLDSLTKGTEGKKDDAESLLTGPPEGALGELPGITTEGATSPDPDLLKQLEQGDLSPTAPSSGKP